MSSKGNSYSETAAVLLFVYSASTV